MWSGLNLYLSLLVQMMVIQGSGTHCLSSVPVSSQLVHTVATCAGGAWVGITLSHVVLPLVHGHVGVLIGS